MAAPIRRQPIPRVGYRRPGSATLEITCHAPGLSLDTSPGPAQAGGASRQAHLPARIPPARASPGASPGARGGSADLPTKPATIPTPLADAPCHVLADTVAIVPILRAGLGMADGVLDLIPEAEVWHVGLFRDEATLRPTQYYNKLPTHSRASLALLVDPMLATGGSAVHACEILGRDGNPSASR